MSDFSDFCDDVLLQIQEQVPGFDPSQVPDDGTHVHRYAAWNPLELVADGSRHLAVWPMGEAAETTQGIAQGYFEIAQAFAVLAWEDSVATSGRAVADEDADRAWLQAANDLRDFFYQEANRQRAYGWGGYYRIRHVATDLPVISQAVRWVRLTIAADRTIGFT